MGTSPTAQCAKRREVVSDPGPTPEGFSLQQLAQELHRIHAQGVIDAVFFDDTHDQTNDHLDCLKLLKSQILSPCDNIAQVSKDLLSNDAEVKVKLEDLETIVTTQGVDMKQLLDKTKQSIQEVASYAATKGLGPAQAEVPANAQCGSRRARGQTREV